MTLMEGRMGKANGSVLMIDGAHVLMSTLSAYCILVRRYIQCFFIYLGKA